MEIEVSAKKWGSSLGVVLPKPLVELYNIQENDKILLDVKKKHKALEFFGVISQWKKSTKSIKDEMKKGW